MSDLLRSYLTVGIFAGVAVALVAAIMGLGSLVRPTRPQPEKYLNYESGVDPAGSMWGQTAGPLLHLRPAVRAVRRRGGVHLPVGHPARGLRRFGLVEMVIFIVILALGLLYAWRKGVLRWI